MPFSTNHIRWIKLDFLLQTLLFVVGLNWAAQTPLMLLAMAVPVGFWQSVGGLVYFFIFEDKRYRYYLICLVLYLAVLYALYLSDTISDGIMVPTVPLAIWNYGLAIQGYGKIKDWF